MPDFLNLNGQANSNGGGPEMSEFIQQTDEARAVARPSDVEKFWIESECDVAEIEQCKLYKEKAEVEARGADTVAAELSHEAEEALTVSKAKGAQADTARQRHEHDEAVLRQYARRRTDAKPTYWVRGPLFLAGDTAGFTGAALLLGDPVFVAIAQGLSAGLSALTLGGVGRELRYLLAAKARRKTPKELKGKEREYAQWFTGPDTVDGLVKIIGLICLTGVLLFTGGIFELREAAEGLEVALAFGCFALTLGLASFYNSFDVADEVAEYLDAGAAKVKHLDKVAEKARKDEVIARWRGALAHAKSVRAANEAAGEAAAHGLRRRLYGILNQNPGVAGNGPAPKRTNGHRPNGPRRPGDS